MDNYQNSSITEEEILISSSSANIFTQSSFEETEESESDNFVALVVEDEEICQNFLKEALKEMSIKTKIAVTVSEAKDCYLELAKERIPIAVVFLDIILKDKSTGIEFLKMIRENNWMKETLIIVMSGIEDIDTMKECYNYNIQNYIRKPITRVNFLNERAKIEMHLKNFKCPIPGYKIEKEIGSGVSATVYCVRHKKTLENYAMKVIQLGETNVNKNFEESDVMRNLKSPTILEFKESRILDNKLYLIMEYAENGTLSNLIQENEKKKECFTADQILDWMTQLFLGLLVIHEKNLMHRDIKTDNLFICKNQMLKIGDLGIAKATNDGKAITVCGTVFYMAPEMFHYQKYDLTVDIWAAGVVLYELCMLRKPFEGKNADEIKARIQHSSYNAVPENTDERIKLLLKVSMCPDPSQRYHAKDILKLPFMLERIQTIFVNDNESSFSKIMDTITKSNFRTRKSLNSSHDYDSDPHDSSLEKQQFKNYYKIFKDATRIEASAVKRSYKPGYFHSSIENVIDGYYLQLSADDNCISTSNVENLIQNKMIVKINEPYNLKLDNSSKIFYQVRLFEDDKIDNSIKCEIQIDRFLVDDPVQASCDCLIKIQLLLKKVKDIVEEEDFEKQKTELVSSQEYLDFLLAIKTLKYLKMDTYNKQQKLAIILNVYQTMYLHYNLKALLTEDTLQSKGIIESFWSLFQKCGKNIDIIYEISGRLISIYEMKHIVIRRNLKPPHAYFRLAGSSDPRIRFIDDEVTPLMLMKLHFLCLDPPCSDQDTPLHEEPTITIFKESSVYIDIEEHCKKFVSEHVKIEDTLFNLPRFLKEYISDFGGSEKEMINNLLNIYSDPDRLTRIILKQINAGELIINYT